MIKYEEVLAFLRANADEKYRAFHHSLLKSDVSLIGVRTPVLRRYAKKLKGELFTLLTFPDDYYEITFLKCAVAAALPYEEFQKIADSLVALLENWATCDMFKAPCIADHREDFRTHVANYLKSDREFTVRYGLVTLLHFYLDPTYFSLLEEAVAQADCSKYYISMAAAWLIAEALVKYPAEGERLLALADPITRRRALQKARDSFRVSKARKEQISKKFS